jgi:hypothetical protein
MRTIRLAASFAAACFVLFATVPAWALLRSNKLRRGSQLLRRRLQRTRDQPSPVSGLRQPLRHSILPGHSDRQRICTDGFNSCNNGCDALAAIPTAAAIQNQTACASRCCGQFKVCLGQRSRDVAAITCQ